MANQPMFVPLTLLALAADPAIEAAGSIYYNTVTGGMRKSDGAVWSDIGSNDLVGGFDRVVSSESLTVPANRIVLAYNNPKLDGIVAVNGTLVVMKT